MSAAGARRAPSGRRTWPPSSPPASGRGVAADEVALARGRLDAVIAGLLFMAGMRRSEVSALLWGDVAEAAAGDGVLVTVCRGKTNPEGESRDVRFVKGDVAGDVRTLRAAASSGPEDRVAGGGAVGRRRAGDRPLRPCGAGDGADEPWGVDDRRDAGRELEDLSDGGALLVRGDGRAGGGGAVPLKPRVRPPAATTWSVHRLAAVVGVLPVGFVGRRLDDAEVQRQRREHHGANRIPERGRGRLGPHRGGVVLVGHLVEGRDGPAARVARRRCGGQRSATTARVARTSDLNSGSWNWSGSNIPGAT